MLRYCLKKMMTSIVESSGLLLLVVLLSLTVSPSSGFTTPKILHQNHHHQQKVFTTTTTVTTPFLNRQKQQQQLSRQYDARERGGCVLFMGWGPDPIWSTAEIKSTGSANESGKSTSLIVDIPSETAKEYKVPGQYVQVRLNEETKPLFLAIASPPDEENASFEFLIKKTDDNGWITDASSGTTVEISQVLGNGFPIEENLEGFKYDFPTQNVLLFAAGSGIAPLKAAIESGTCCFLLC